MKLEYRMIKGFGMLLGALRHSVDVIRIHHVHVVWCTCSSVYSVRR